MILVALVFIGLLAAMMTAWRLNAAIGGAQERFRALLGGYGDARRLAGARRRFRGRQKRVETALDVGTVGLETAHRGVAHWMTGKYSDSGAGVYAWMRALNRSTGRALSGLLAPPPRRPDSSGDKRPACKSGDHDDDDSCGRG